ncbi:hypothetical protein E2C01_032477 [Portunus trituberculatus]|uniref:Uncharacterized protein n=1 Tax=Portunus trituberculatus TaxID=210409 RepID=A0A5B7F0D5_PORTR|nr:hypothetical protein [Portunus trituberculatus]
MNHTQGPPVNPAQASGGHRNRQEAGATQPWREQSDPTHTTLATLLDLTHPTLTPRPATPTTTTYQARKPQYTQAQTPQSYGNPYEERLISGTKQVECSPRQIKEVPGLERGKNEQQYIV